MEYIGVLNTDDWAACRVTRLQKFQEDNNSASVVELATRESASLNQDGFESYAEFHFKSPDGTLERVAMQSFYRLCRTVISQVVEYGALSDSDLDKVVNDAYVALSDSYDRRRDAGPVPIRMIDEMRSYSGWTERAHVSSGGLLLTVWRARRGGRYAVDPHWCPHVRTGC